MLILPAIDLYGGKAVRLYKGRYDQMTVYNDDPSSVALDFKASGASWMHLVDLEGARDGNTPNLETVARLVSVSGLSAEIGGGIRDLDTIAKYLDIGVERVILGTAAVTDPELVPTAVRKYGSHIAVGADLRDGFVAIKGWLENSSLTADQFFIRMTDAGVQTVICTDISKDGAMSGTNTELYRTLSAQYPVNIIASGGVSSLQAVKDLRALDLYGAIIGKAYYTGDITLSEAIGVAR